MERLLPCPGNAVLGEESWQLAVVGGCEEIHHREAEVTGELSEDLRIELPL